jgi:hypothetical protein
MVKKKHKEEIPMKQNKKYSHLRVVNSKQPMYPNAADNNYFARKAVDVMTALASGFGLFSAMIFLVTMI